MSRSKWHYVETKLRISGLQCDDVEVLSGFKLFNFLNTLKNLEFKRLGAVLNPCLLKGMIAVFAVSEVPLVL